MAANRWDRSTLKHMSYKQRLEVERRLAKGEESGKKISDSMGFPKSMWVSAVKKNPIPGGVLDPKGKLADYEGVWVDPQCKVRPYVGLGKDKTPIIKEALDPNRSHWKKGQTGNPRTNSQSQSNVGTRAIPGGSDRANLAKGLDNPRSPETGKGEPSIQAPMADHEGSTIVEDLGAPLPPSDKMKKKLKSGSKTLRQARLFSRRALPLKDRIDLLAKLARGIAEPQVALRAISMLNDIDGLIAAAKEPSAANLGGGPLFQLPKDMAMSFAPVGRTESIPIPNSGILDNLEDEQEGGEGEDEEPTPQS